MAKKKITIEMLSYGIYTEWDRKSKALPKIKKHTHTVPAVLDIEFGYVLQIKGAKGQQITFRMTHPPFRDEKGNIRPDFTGSHYVNSNDWKFFLGDTIWGPTVDDKCGDWEITTYLEGKEIARKKFTIVK